MTRLAWQITLAVVTAGLILLAGVGIGSLGEPVPPPRLVDRDAYAAGWVYAVTYQVGPAPRPPGDDLTRAACRWRIDGSVNPPAPRWDRTAFLAGCDDAVADTDLEKPTR